MEIYGAILSPYVARVAVAARFKGIKHTLLMPKDGIKSAAFLKINPLGKMPALKDGKAVLFESAVILEYLEAKSKKKRLIPAAAKAAAKVRLTGALFGEYVMAPTMGLFRQRDPATRDQAVIDTKLAEINKGLDAVEAQLGKPYAVGKFSMADCYAVPAMFFLHVMLPIFGVQNPLGARPKLKAYWARLQKDKLTAAVLAEMGVELKAFRG